MNSGRYHHQHPDHEMIDAKNNTQPITNYNIINAKSNKESERKRIDDRPTTSTFQSSPIDGAKMKRRWATHFEYLRECFRNEIDLPMWKPQQKEIYIAGQMLK